MDLPDGNHPPWIDPLTGISRSSNVEGIQGAVARLVERSPDDKHMGVTLGAVRRGKYVPFVPRDSTLDVWTACASQEMTTGVIWPHAYFIQTLGGSDAGHILCPSCRSVRVKLRIATPSQSPSGKKPKVNPNQGSLF